MHMRHKTQIVQVCFHTKADWPEKIVNWAVLRLHMAFAAITGRCRTHATLNEQIALLTASAVREESWMATTSNVLNCSS
jgi:hypothetical protein